MNKAVLIAMQPYYVFLIIARAMGWDIPQNKTVEVRKDFPRDSAWNRAVHIYCSQNKKSFNRIPAKYQHLMAKLIGKVVGRFVCDSIRKGRADNSAQAYCHNSPDETCLTDQELLLYANAGKPLYFWHIFELKIYDTPKELQEFRTITRCKDWQCFEACSDVCGYAENNQCRCGMVTKRIITAPQSWYYVESINA